MQCEDSDRPTMQGGGAVEQQEQSVHPLQEPRRLEHWPEDGGGNRADRDGTTENSRPKESGRPLSTLSFNSSTLYTELLLLAAADDRRLAALGHPIRCTIANLLSRLEHEPSSPPSCGST
jgi:hypothetical protein